MSGLGNKEIFSKNLRRIMEEHGIDRRKLCETLNFKYSTFSDWYNGNKYPRIDKIEMLANYFGIQKSDLIEEPTNDSDNDPDIRRIQRARKNMPQKDKEKMMQILKLSFDRYFADDFKYDDHDDDE